MMPKRLLDLEVDEISLVDAPANQHAKVFLFKRDAGDMERPAAREQPEPFQADRVETSRTPKPMEQKMYKSSEVHKMHSEAIANLFKARDKLDNEFDQLVSKHQRPDEGFGQAYDRLLATDAGRAYYSEHKAFDKKVAAISKLTNDAFRTGSVAADDEHAGSSDESAGLEQGFEAFVHKNMGANEPYETAYLRLIDSREGREFYRKRAAL